MSDRDQPRLCRVAGRGTWHIYHNRRRVSTGCTDRAEAEVILSRYIEGSNRESLPIVSIEAILGKYLKNRKEKGIPGAERLEWAHKPLIKFWAARPPEVVTESECRAYGEKRGVSQATIRTELQALRAALRWAAAERLIDEAPTVHLPPRPPAREKWLTREQAGKFLRSCSAPHIRLFAEIALRTAARKSAILELTWDRVDLDRRLIDFRVPGQAQTRKKRIPVPINETLLEILSGAKARATTEFVIEWAGGRVRDVKHGFRDAAIRAGIKGTTPHTLRHTAATWMAQEGVPLWEIAGFLGHSDVTMISETYGHHHPDHLARAAKALG